MSEPGRDVEHDAAELAAVRLRGEAAQLEHLLGELRELVVPAAWQRIERVLRGVVALHGAGLARALDHARAAGAAPEALDGLIVDDELLASLLVLHGLHPLPVADRVRRALAALRAELVLPEHALVLVAIDERGARLAVGEVGGSQSPRVIERLVRRALEAAAPELDAIEIDGPQPPAPDRLVQIRTAR